MWALLPLKNFSGAKQRLSGVLTPEERSGLFLAMVRDVLSVLQSHPDIDNTLIVSDAAEAQQLARDFGAQCLTESSLNVSGLNEAVQAGVNVLAGRGIDDVMIIHGDLPLISSGDISQLIHTHQQQLMVARDTQLTSIPMALTISPDERREGSNCLLCTPASSMTYRYGCNSFALHTEQARKLSMPMRVVYMAGAACDVDTPHDLAILLRRATPDNASHSYAYMAEQALAERVMVTVAPTLESTLEKNMNTQADLNNKVGRAADIDMQYGWAG